MAVSLCELFPYTQINESLPLELRQLIHQIINYRFGTLPSSNMMTIEIRSYTEPGACYRFNQGSLKLDANPDSLVSYPPRIEIPKHVELRGQWTDTHSPARIEANVLGRFSSFFTDRDEIIFPVEEATAEKLAYYNSLLIRQGESVNIDSRTYLPLTVVRFEENYKDGYLKLPEYGGGYYLEVHDTPHFWSPLSSDCSGALLLGKKVGEDRYHISAFKIPYGTAIYAPGGVIHCDGLLVGDIMAIYTVTPDYSTVILKNQQNQVVDVELIAA